MSSSSDLAHVVHLVGFRHRDFAHEGTAVALGTHQPALGQRPQRFADRPAAGTEVLGELYLVDALAGRQLAAQDHLLDLGLYQRRQGVGLQQLQRRERVHGSVPSLGYGVARHYTARRP